MATRESTCACGCNGTPTLGKRYLHGHSLKQVNATLTTEDRRKRGLATAATHTFEEWSEWGRRGGRESDIKRWAALLEKWRTLGPREGLRAAYAQGYNTCYQACKKGCRRVPERQAS